MPRMNILSGEPGISANKHIKAPEKNWSSAHKLNKIEHGKKDYVFHISSSRVLSNILATFEVNFPDEPHLSDILAHFRQFDTKVLDKFSEFSVILEKYNTKITFITSRVEYSGMLYTLTDWNSVPCKEFLRKKFLGIF